MKILTAFLLCLLVLPAHALDGAGILKKVDRNLEPESYEMLRKLINVEPDGSKKEFVLYSVKKGRDRIVALFLAPPSDKGRATLRLGDNMWLYIPEVGKPMRITSLQSVTGGKDIDLDVKVDPTIIGGLIVKVGSRMVDSSLRTKLNAIKFAMKEAR